PAKPLWGSPVGVHTILCLGRRSFLFSETRVAMGSVSSNPRGCWSVHGPAPRYPCEPARTALPFVLWVDGPFNPGSQTSTASVPPLPDRKSGVEGKRADR